MITSGGGFSTIYPAPSWQTDTLQTYFHSIGTGRNGSGGIYGNGQGAPAPGYNRGGRGYPDISALAFNYVIAVNRNLTVGKYFNNFLYLSFIF